MWPQSMAIDCAVESSHSWSPCYHTVMPCRPYQKLACSPQPPDGAKGSHAANRHWWPALQLWNDGHTKRELMPAAGADKLNAEGWAILVLLLIPSCLTSANTMMMEQRKLMMQTARP